MYYKLYKVVKLCSEERARLTHFWMRQERLKRQLDADMSAARAELVALPSDIPLPHEFLSHLNTLIATPFTSLHTAADSQHTAHAAGYPHTYLGDPTCLPQHMFIGQHPKEVLRAERSLWKLRYVMEASNNLLIDVLNAAMPGVLLEVEKCQKLWSDLFLSQLSPPDFLELCHIAAMQQNRCSLFQDPF